MTKMRIFIARLLNTLASVVVRRGSLTGTLPMTVVPGGSTRPGRRTQYGRWADAAGARPGDTVVVDPDGSARVVGRKPELSIDNTRGLPASMTTGKINLPEHDSELTAVLSPLGFAKPENQASSSLLVLLELQGEFRVQLIAAGLTEAAAMEVSCAIMDSFMVSAAAAPGVKQAYLESLQ